MPGITNPEARRNAVGLLSSKQRFQHHLHRLMVDCLDLIFPPTCAGCGRVDVPWCAQCQRELVAAPLTLSRRRFSGVTEIVSTGTHEGQLQQAVHTFKYDHTFALCQPLGNRLVSGIKQMAWQVDLVIPVPLHSSREAQRGYNQAQLLAEYTAGKLAIACRPEAIWRHRDTPSQVGLNRKERLQNVMGAFEADANLVSAKTVLLIDDVCTTGATMAACAQAALVAGAMSVYGMTVTAARI